MSRMKFISICRLLVNVKIKSTMEPTNDANAMKSLNMSSYMKRSNSQQHVVRSIREKIKLN